jgi:hypothetical protein
VTAAEHQRIVPAEHDTEKRLYYGLLWEIGAAQSDAALLVAENIVSVIPTPSSGGLPWVC